VFFQKSRKIQYKLEMIIMKITLLGTGLPMPNPKRKGPSQLVTLGEEHLLIDCGPGAVHRMTEIGVMPNNIHQVYLTHQHADHYLDLDYFILIRWLMGEDRPLEIYGPVGTKLLINNLMTAHAYDYENRLNTIGGDKKLPTFKITEIDEGPIKETDGAIVTAFNVVHMPNDLSFGFRFDANDSSIVFSGDTAPCENLIKHSHQVDILVHECVDSRKSNLAKSSTWKSSEDRIAHMRKIHTFPEDLGMVAQEAKPKKLVTTHMVPATVPQELQRQIAENFDGKIIVGEDLMELWADQ